MNGKSMYGGVLNYMHQVVILVHIYEDIGGDMGSWDISMVRI